MPDTDDLAFSPSTWWVWLLIGLGGLILTVVAGAVFGVSAIDVLLGREIALVLFIAFDYVFIALGIWLAIKTVLRKGSRNAL